MTVPNIVDRPTLAKARAAAQIVYEYSIDDETSGEDLSLLAALRILGRFAKYGTK